MPEAPRQAGELLAAGARYWEPRRIPYNLALVAVTVAFAARRWPAIRHVLDWPDLLRLAVLALLANGAYCAVYLAELMGQASPRRATWPRWRGALWLAGTLFAALLAAYWLGDEIAADLDVRPWLR